MSNWFQNHPVVSILSYTIIVIASTAGVMLFVLVKNKDNLHKTIVSNLRLENGQQVAKIDYLKFENEKLREQNFKYYEWLSSSPSTVAYLEKKVSISEFKADSFRSSESPDIRKIESKNQRYMIKSRTLRVGEAFVDPKTGCSLGVFRFDIYNNAKGTVSLPNQESFEFDGVSAGQKWDFSINEKKYELIFVEGKYLTDHFVAMVLEILE